MILRANLDCIISFSMPRHFQGCSNVNLFFVMTYIADFGFQLIIYKILHCVNLNVDLLYIK